MACKRYCLFVNERGRKVTQPLHHEGDPPAYYDTADGERLPLVMVGTYHEAENRTSHVAMRAKANHEWAEVERRRRDFGARRAS